MNQLRSIVSATLDKVSLLLKSEPARAIGYGAAVVVYLVILVLNSRGITRFGSDLKFEDAVLVHLAASTAAAMTLVGSVVESIRRFVYSPQTFIEQLSDEWQNGHDEAHFEEAMNAAIQKALEQRAAAAQQAQPDTTFVMPIGQTDNRKDN